MKIVRATKSRADSVVRHRVEMFRSMGWSDQELERSEYIIRAFLRSPSAHGIDCYLALEDGKVLGGCAVSIQRTLPSYRNPSGLHAYLHNMYVEPEYRRRGIATALLEFIVETYRKKGVSRFELHATDMGRLVYERLGFEKSDNYYVKSFQSD